MGFKGLGRRRDGAARKPQALDSSEVLLYRVTGLSAPGERRIGIACGHLRRTRCAEVWVNSENTGMQMARPEEFSVSSIIRYDGAVLDDAGRIVEDVIADELAARIAGRAPVPPGTVILTGPGELRRRGVRLVAHVAAVHGEPGLGFRQVRDVGRCVTNVLAQVDAAGLDPPAASVLFPLLGVGHGGGAPEPTVKAIVGAAIDYLAATPASSLTAVYLLAYSDVELAAVRRVFAADRRLLAIGDDKSARIDARIARDAEPPAAPTPPAAPARRQLRIGFVLDVAQFGGRTAHGQEKVQRRLFRLTALALSDTGVEPRRADLNWTGDGALALLPGDVDPTAAVPGLLRSVTRRLADDNRENDDRIRLRMAVGIGIAGPGATGLIGAGVIGISRMVDSATLRDALQRHPDSDVVALLSEHVYTHIVQPGYPGLDAGELRSVDVSAKEFREAAWLWIPPAET